MAFYRTICSYQKPACVSKSDYKSQERDSEEAGEKPRVRVQGPIPIELQGRTRVGLWRWQQPQDPRGSQFTAPRHPCCCHKTWLPETLGPWLPQLNPHVEYPCGITSKMW